MIINLDYLNSGGGSGSGVTPSEVNALINSAITQGEYINNAEYISSAKTIVLYQDETEVATIDATAFIKDGMVDSVYISGTNLVIDFNTDSGKQDIEIPLSDIFDPSNYYTKTDVDAIASGKVDTSALSAYTLQSDFVTHSGNTNIHTTLAEKAVWNGKQDALRFYTEDSDGLAQMSVDESSGIQVYEDLVNIVSNGTEMSIRNTGVTIDGDPVVTASQLNDYYTSAQTESAITQAVSSYQPITGMSAYTLESNFVNHSGNTIMHTTAQEKVLWNSVSDKADTSVVSALSLDVNTLSASVQDIASGYVTGATCGDDYGNELVDMNGQDIDLQRMRDNLIDKIANETLNTWWQTSDQTSAATITYNASLGFETTEWDIEAEEWRNNGTVEFFIMSAEFDMDGNDELTGVTITPIDRTITLDGFDITQLADYQPLLSAGTGIDITNNVISATGGGSVTVDPSLDTGSTNPVANSAITNGFNTYTLKADAEDGIKRYFYVSSPANPYGNQAIWNFSINGRCPLTKETGGANSTIDKFYLVETSAITSAITSASTNSEVAGAKAVFDAIQAGGGGGVSSAEVETMISEAVSGKQDTLVSGTNIKTINNQSLLGSGNITISGATYEYYTEDTENKSASINIETDDGEGNTGQYWLNVSDGVNDFGASTETDDGEGNVTSSNGEIMIEPSGVVTISASNSEGGQTTMAYLTVETTGVSINGDNVVTEAAFQYNPVTSALTITFLNA